jgi:hypothetical protein
MYKGITVASHMVWYITNFQLIQLYKVNVATNKFHDFLLTVRETYTTLFIRLRITWVMIEQFCHQKD